MEPLPIMFELLLSRSCVVLRPAQSDSSIQQAGAVGVDGCLGLAERVGGLAALAQADQAPGPGAQVVVGDDLLAAPRANPRSTPPGAWAGRSRTGPPSGWDGAGKRHATDHLGDPHGDPPLRARRGPAGAPVVGTSAPICLISEIDFPAGSTTSKFTPSRRTARATASGSAAVAARTPVEPAGPPDRHRRLVGQHQGPRCGASATHRAVDRATTSSSPVLFEPGPPQRRESPPESTSTAKPHSPRLPDAIASCSTPAAARCRAASGSRGPAA